MKSIFFCVCVVLGKETRALYMLGKCSPSELYPQPSILLLLLTRREAIPNHSSYSFKKFWGWQSGSSSKSACLQSMRSWVQTRVTKKKKSVFKLTSTDITIWHNSNSLEVIIHAFYTSIKKRNEAWTSDNSEYLYGPEFVVYKIKCLQ
jgi:hypothetical protein